MAPAEDRRDRMVGAIKRVEETVFVPVISILLLSPLWGVGLWWVLDWPVWLGIVVAIVPAGCLFLSGVMHVYLRKWTNLRRSTATSLEPLLITIALLAGVAVPIALYYD